MQHKEEGKEDSTCVITKRWLVKTKSWKVQSSTVARTIFDCVKDSLTYGSSSSVCEANSKCTGVPVEENENSFGHT